MMGLGMLCARRAAILAALAGGFVVAVLGAGVCSEGIVWGGGALVGAVKGGIAYLVG